MAATRAGATRALRRHGDEPATVPLQLVVQLTAELKPALIEDGFVQAGLGPNVSARILDIAFGRLAHIAHPQVLNAHHRVVLADSGCGLVQIVTPGVADTGMDTRQRLVEHEAAGAGKAAHAALLFAVGL